MLFVQERSIYEIMKMGTWTSYDSPQIRQIHLQNYTLKSQFGGIAMLLLELTTMTFCQMATPH